MKNRFERQLKIYEKYGEAAKIEAKQREERERLEALDFNTRRNLLFKRHYRN